jgi:uncharacterized membrane protein
LRIRLGDGLLLANILSWLLITVILLLPQNPLRIILGIPFVLFFPGYVLITTLVPGKEGMSGIERIALSFGLSIALVILIGLGLNYTPFGIKLTPIMFSVAGVMLALSIIARFRTRRLLSEKRFSISINLSPASIWRGSPFDKALSVILVIVILGSLGAVAYTIAKPKPGEEFAEFYILGPGGKAEDYPSSVKAGEKAKVTGGIINNFRTPVSFRIEVTIDGTNNTEIGPINLEPKAKWEEEIDFTTSTVGTDQKVEFFLYKDNNSEVVESLHLWVDVIQ